MYQPLPDLTKQEMNNVKKSRTIVLALTGLAVLCVCAAMAAPPATGDRGMMMEDGRCQDGSKNITRGNGTATEGDGQGATGDRGMMMEDGKSTDANNPAGSDSQSTQTPAPFFVVIPAVCIGLILHLKKK
ncbi:hypothetical protein [Methanogenium sp. MK-MG]|uniref:hypothetical protein n=1 Tax=Methanogenium sp. MK-MG TaxID=2599926 RepID=UPI0013EB2E8B|nr:hypothetical protein [Methanogenium sp. MK-MG]KAF1074659.1 hypothetical protein MKMG_01916 [Methanogenium sp. MK-MG]